jgi:DNA repair exonuclease SbcCD ATPase subunit
VPSTSAYDDAVNALYRAPHDSFVSERARLAAKLKESGDKAGAARLAKLARPTLSAWVVNQLFWHARADFDALFASAKELRAGKLSHSGAHREALAKLNKRAQQLLGEHGHAASEATLRRVAMTLAALAAAGSFDPEPAGALTKDRDPPGFDAFGSATFEAKEQPPKKEAEPKKDRAANARHEHERVEAEKKRAAEALTKKRAAREKLQAALHQAKTDLSARERTHDKLEHELAKAEADLERAQAALKNAEAELAAFEREA